MTKRKEYYQAFDIPSLPSSTNLLKIMNFYLFSCPVPGKSVRGISFAEYGFKGKKAFSALKREMLKSASISLDENYKPCKKEELGDAFYLIENVSPPNEYCVFLKHDEKNITASLFVAIRNAFAHGSFNVKSYNGVRIFFFVNFDGYKKAQLVLQEKTLLAWIQIVEGGYNKLIQQ